jgi:hypothetical protein
MSQPKNHFSRRKMSSFHQWSMRETQYQASQEKEQSTDRKNHALIRHKMTRKGSVIQDGRNVEKKINCKRKER